MKSVKEIYDKIDGEWARVAAAWEEEHGAEFPCKAGCSDCCKASMAGMPYISMPMGLPEGEYLLQALRELPEFQREMLGRRRIGGFHQACLLLLGDGRCMAYEARPLWCRIFGLDGGPHACGRIPPLVHADLEWQEAAIEAFEVLRGEGGRVFIHELVDGL